MNLAAPIVVTVVVLSAVTPALALPDAPEQRPSDPLSAAPSGTGIAGAIPGGVPSSPEADDPPPERLRDESTVVTDSDGPPRVADPEPRYLPAVERDYPVKTESLRGGSAAGSSSDVAGATSPSIGDARSFLALDTVLGQYYFKEYRLLGVGEHAEVWVASDLSWPAGVDDPRDAPVVTERQAQHLADEFDEQILPAERDFFGDPDDHDGTNSAAAALGLPADYWASPEGKTVVLVDNVRDNSYYDASYPTYIAGFYATQFERIHDRNVVTVDAYGWDRRLGSDDAPWRPMDGDETRPFLIERVLAHEFQHLIHADIDPDEETWVNEGLSMLAEFLTGYGHPEATVGFFEENPSNSLTTWGDQGATNIVADYGVAYLYYLYLYEKRGPAFVQDVVHSQENGIESIDSTLAAHGDDADFGDIYQDFSTTLAVDTLAAAGFSAPARYQFRAIDLSVALVDLRPPPRRDPFPPDRGTPSQRDPPDSYDGLDPGLRLPASAAPAWGNSYRTVPAAGAASISRYGVSGVRYPDTDWQVAPDPLGADDAVLWSGDGDLVDRVAAFEVDLRDVDSATLEFETFYDIETAWDYGAVQVSTDDGETWTSLSNENTTSIINPDAHPHVRANRPGFTGASEGWTTETFDLSQYAGQRVVVSFRYVTDWAFTGQGWFVRNVEVPEVGVSLDGSSVAPFASLREVRGDAAMYQFTLVGLGGDGDVSVRQYDARSFTSGRTPALRPLPGGDTLAGLLLIATWEANPREHGTVPYEVDIRYSLHLVPEPVEANQEQPPNGTSLGPTPL